MNLEKDNKENEEDHDPVLDKIPTKYRDLYDSDDFEKFTHRKDWYD